MTKEERQTLREKHSAVHNKDCFEEEDYCNLSLHFCLHCNQELGFGDKGACDVIKVLDALDEAEAHIERVTDELRTISPSQADAMEILRIHL